MSDDDAKAGDRLQKVLAAAGYGSRRECEELITDGRVEIDGEVAQELGVRVDPDSQTIHVDGVLVKTPRKRYYLLNKPKGVLSTNRDPSGRTRAIDLVPEEARVFTVGRLDKESEGLLLLTNDGELANRLAHPRYGVPKTYHVAVQGEPEEAQLRMLKDGVPLAEGIARVAEYKIRRKTPTYTELEITLREGKNREIRRIFAKLGHKVLRLRRISLGPLRLGDIPVGAHRELKREELERLREAAGSIPMRKRARRPGGVNSRRALEEGKRQADRRRAETGSSGAGAPRAGHPAGKSAKGAPKRPAGLNRKFAGKRAAARGDASRPGAARPGATPGKPTSGRGKVAGRRPAGDLQPQGRQGRVFGYDDAASGAGSGPKKRPPKKAAGGSRPPAAGAKGKRPIKKAAPPKTSGPKTTGPKTSGAKIPLSKRLRQGDDD